MHLVPLERREDIERLAGYWLPFLDRIATSSRQPIQGLIADILGWKTQLGIIWDGKQARALVGWQFKNAGKILIAEIIYVSGNGVKEYRDVLSEIEKYLKGHVKCHIIRPICRPGWAPFLKGRGYKLTHYVMEKAL